MFASIRTYRFEAGSMDDLMHRVDRDFADALAQEPGFVAYQVMATGPDTIMSISVFRSQDEADRSNEIAAQWVAEDLADFDVHRMGAMTGEVMVSRAQAEVLEPAHH
jgi:quinol monooxygenase YgiN